MNSDIRTYDATSFVTVNKVLMDLAEFFQDKP